MAWPALHSTRLYDERTMIAFDPRCPSSALSSQEEDEEKGTFKPVEEDTFQSGVDSGGERNSKVSHQKV